MTLQMTWVPFAKGQQIPTLPASLAHGTGTDFEPIAHWDDGSVRVAHYWADWVDGAPVLDWPGDDWPDISWVGSAPVVTELRGKATCAHVGKVVRDTPFRRVTLFEGPLKQPGVPDYAYRRTWVTSFRGHQTILVDHSITWIRPMRDYRVMGVEFAGRPQWCTSVADLSPFASWADRIQWDGAKPLGEGLAAREVVGLTAAIPTSEFNENRKEHYIFADLHGTTIRDRWSIGLPVDALAFSEWPATRRCDDAWIEASGIFPVSCGKKDAVDQYIVDMAEHFHWRATPGRFTEGNPPYNWVVKENRPNAHRPGIGAYYSWGETLWTEYARLGDPELLRCARLMTGHTVQFGQLAHGSKSLIPSEDFSNQLDKWHRNAGAFWKLGEPVGCPPGMPESDWWSAHVGRQPDPMHLHYAWVFDGDQRAKWGFDLWRQTINFGTLVGAINREGNKTIGVMSDWADWYPDDRARVCPYIEQLAVTHMKKPLYDVDPGPLWDPFWVNKALPHVTDATRTALLNYVSACRTKMREEGITRLKDTEAIGLSLLMPRSGGWLEEHLPWVAHQVHRADGVGPGPLGDQFLARQWGHLRKALEASAVIPERTWPVRVPVANLSYGDVGNIGRRGTRFLMKATGNKLSFQLHGISQAADPAGCTWVVTDTAGARIESGSWLWLQLGPSVPATGGYVGNYTVTVPTADANYYVCVGGHALELLPIPGCLGVTLPAGTYFVRCPNRFKLKVPGGLGVLPSVGIASESKESWVEVETALGMLPRMVIGGPTSTVTPNIDIIDFNLIAGGDPQAKLVLTHPMELVL